MNKNEYSGITCEKANELQKQYGKNELVSYDNENIFKKIINIICEPMFLLLLVASAIYFVLGEPKDGAIMLIFIVGIISIDIVQELKTDKTLKALKNLSAPKVTVIRDNKEILIKSCDLVPGDLMFISEGTKIPADGTVIKTSDLRVDESSLTGESEAVWKQPKNENIKSNDYWKPYCCYAGTLVTQGSGYVLVDKIGNNTEYGKIGKETTKASKTVTPLQKQTAYLVKLCAFIAIGLLIVVSAITYFNIANYSFSDKIIKSILSGIALAMAMIPEEFPVVLTVFLSMGAWRLAKKNSLVRKLPSVETLGEISVLCVDKTGTITTNEMSVKEFFTLENNKHHLHEVLGLSCEENTYDPMEKAIISYCEANNVTKNHLLSGNLIKEYPFTNELKMMGHVWNHDNEIIVAAKGSCESILKQCTLKKEDKDKIDKKIIEMYKNGLRVLAVCDMHLKSEKEIPNELSDCKLNFCGLVGLYDPPRESVKKDIKKCEKAGIRVIMITGDNGITASSIAKQVGIPNADKIITGNEIDLMTDDELKNIVKEISIFSRVIPQHKMRIIKALQANGLIVAMTGDGVNDAPALKHADIGISMGKRGAEVSREAADLILMDDNFSTIVDTIKDGRRIYDNIRKAISYIFTIHIPIAGAALFAPLLGIQPENLLFLPIHVVLLELIIDPTCSIVLERQPPEPNIMQRKPRNPKENILTKKVLLKSLVQGACIFLSSFLSYIFIIKLNNNVNLARTIGLCIIILSNLFLVQVNSSETEPTAKTIKILLKDKIMWAINIFTFTGLAVILYTPVTQFLNLSSLSFWQMILTILISAISVLWYDIIKLIKRHKLKNQI